MVRLSEVREAVAGLPVDPMEIFNKISSHAKIVVNPPQFSVVRGSQVFGSGGYNAFYRVFHGDLKEHEIIDIIREDTDFITRTEWVYKASLDKPLVVYTHEYDEISSSDHRCFKCELIVINPNVSSSEKGGE